MDAAHEHRAVEAVRRAIAIYAQLLDAGRVEEWGDLFTENACFRVYGRTYQGRDEIRREIGGMQPPPERPAKHVCLVPVVDLDGADRAWAWTDFTAFGSSDEGRIEIATIGRYHDALVFDGARWRFASRSIVMAGEPVPDGVRPSPAQ